MKQGIVLVVMMVFLLVGCGVRVEKSSSLAMENEVTTTTTVVTTTATQETTKQMTKRVTSTASNLYIEIESDKKEKHKYTFVYKSFDECYKAGEELLPRFNQIHPEIVKTECMYLKDDNNRRVWGVLFRTCDDPAAVCNFYY